MKYSTPLDLDILLYSHSKNPILINDTRNWLALLNTAPFLCASFHVEDSSSIALQLIFLILHGNLLHRYFAKVLMGQLLRGHHSKSYFQQPGEVYHL
jgi:hypothetical protein